MGARFLLNITNTTVSHESVQEKYWLTFIWFLVINKLSDAHGPNRPAGAPNTLKQTARIKTICFKLTQIHQTCSGQISRSTNDYFYMTCQALELWRLRRIIQSQCVTKLIFRLKILEKKAAFWSLICFTVSDYQQVLPEKIFDWCQVLVEGY